MKTFSELFYCMFLQTNSAYMLFYERMKVSEKGSADSQQDATSADVNQGTNDSMALSRIDCDEDDRHKLKIELTSDLADVSFFPSYFIVGLPYYIACGSIA